MLEDSVLSIPKELIKKYDRPGPRYTSYPTAPVWSDRFGPEEYAQALIAASKDAAEPLSFYLHIPFCRKRCWFCGCNTTVAKGIEVVDDYLARIDKELAIVKSWLNSRKNISQFHWGGGTPSYMIDAQIRRAFEIFLEKFRLLDDAEVSIELDPRATAKGRVRLLKSLGFNRLSFGIQDFDDAVQSAIGRNQDEKKAIELYDISRKNGFEGINFDLIYGLPAQTPETFKKTIDKVVDLRPDRIALYGFAYLPEGKAHQKKIDASLLPSPETKLTLFKIARERFDAAGYNQIGMDHFVLPNDELAVAAARGKLRRNFMGYTVNAAKDWVGIGMSAISYINKCFAQNHGKLDAYSNAIDNGILAAYRGMALSRDDLIRQHIIMELMCNFKLDLTELGDKFDIEPARYFQREFESLKPFVADGLLEFDAVSIKATPAGKMFIRNIAMTFDAYLNRTETERASVQFSRTI